MFDKPEALEWISNAAALDTIRRKSSETVRNEESIVTTVSTRPYSSISPRPDRSKLKIIPKQSVSFSPTSPTSQSSKSASSPQNISNGGMHVIKDLNSPVDNRSFHCQRAVALPHYDYCQWDLELDNGIDDFDVFSFDEQFGVNDDEDMHIDIEQYSWSSPKSEIVPANTTDEQTHSVFMDAFIQNNRLDHVSQVMGYHPDYLRNFLTTQNFLLREDGPLPYEYRHYIAIIAAARHHCTYLVKLHEQDFLLHNGNPEWLKGIEHAPRKIQDLYEINKVLAHRPWLITKEHMVKLLKPPEPWSLSELMHAIILLTHFHSLCSFVYGCGISAELDIDGFTYHRNGSSGSDSDSSSDTNSETGESLNHRSLQASREEGGVGLEALMERMRKLTEASTEEMSAEELLKRFHSVEHQSAEITVPSTKKSSPKSEILRYVIDDDFSYTDFATRESTSEVPTFRACDYSWDDHGFSLANRLYTDIGNLLDDKFNMAANLTYYTMGDNREVDTSSFRRAIWNYIHCMYGIRHDDYDYSEVNQLLERDLKAYIKTLTCYPERLQKKDYDSVMREFKHSEKVHVNLMLMEARQQAELLYALRALNRYMT